MARSVEFLFHYRCDRCGWTSGSGDRYPLREWSCMKCGHRHEDKVTTLHLNLMSADERGEFADLLRTWSGSIPEGHYYHRGD